MTIVEAASRIGVHKATVYHRIRRLREAHPALFAEFTKVGRDWVLNEKAVEILANMPDERRGEWKKVRV